MKDLAEKLEERETGLSMATKLRYVEKEIPDPADGLLSIKVRVLQYCEYEMDSEGQEWGYGWQDVPTDIEGEHT